jgi:hypothetical protein
MTKAQGAFFLREGVGGVAVSFSLFPHESSLRGGTTKQFRVAARTLVDRNRTEGFNHKIPVKFLLTFLMLEGGAKIH